MGFPLGSHCYWESHSHGHRCCKPLVPSFRRRRRRRLGGRVISTTRRIMRLEFPVHTSPLGGWSGRGGEGGGEAGAAA